MHILVTKRLTLRPPTALDADEIAEGLSNWNVARMLGTVPHPYFAADAEDWIDGPASRPGSLVYTIHREKLIGVVSLDGGGAQPRLGYWLGDRWHGHGYMTEAAQAVIDQALRTRIISGITSSVFADNPASLRVQEKLGFKVSGTTQIFSRARNTMVNALTTHFDAARRAERMRPVAMAAA
ncbi:MAG: GNAT family N-acetyltransferase [Mesorhizobium sp.]